MIDTETGNIVGLALNRPTHSYLSKARGNHVDSGDLCRPDPPWTTSKVKWGDDAYDAGLEEEECHPSSF